MEALHAFVQESQTPHQQSPGRDAMLCSWFMTYLFVQVALEILGIHQGSYLGSSLAFLSCWIVDCKQTLHALLQEVEHHTNQAPDVLLCGVDES